jgi:hypothetical protein
MKKKYLFVYLLLSCLTSHLAWAQYTFMDGAGGLSPYTQDFNTLSGNVAMSGNHLAAIPEVYAQAEFTGGPYTPPSIGSNTGGNPVAKYWQFGDTLSTDRALGGIAGTSTINGTGYVGIRFKNTTASTIIKNLEVQYAMEQWYNSGRLSGAVVNVSYLTSAANVAITSLLSTAGTWTPVPTLTVQAPSTATVIASRNGNSPANRRVAKATIPVNLLPGQEIMIRWDYVLNNSTNGNGLSIDDVVITPETGVFYSKTTGDLNDINNWGINTDGSGTTPVNFITDNQFFYVMSPSATAGVPAAADAIDRIGFTNSALGNTWAVSGANSKIIVGTSAAPAAMRVEFNKNVNGTIDVSSASYFVHRRTAVNGPIGFTLGTLATTSTVEYNSNGSLHSVQPNQYGNLKIVGNQPGTTSIAAGDRSTNAKTLFGNTIVAGTLTLGSGSNLVLGNNDLTVLSSGTISGGSATAYVVTNGSGRLRVLVPRASTTAFGSQVTFPVGSSYTSYTPVTLQQTTNTSDDVFEVRVIDNVYQNYDATTYAPVGAPLTSRIVKKTWFISKEVPQNASNVTMTTQWNAGEVGTAFNLAAAHINHYTEGAWDTNATETGATGSGPYVLKRTGITSFSPFGVSSQPAGVLPVELTAFGAQRTSTGVRCAWSTASEQNSRSFSVERSFDGQTFTTLGSVAAAGSSVTPRSYAFFDAQPSSALAYYRLRQIDLDGKQAFSNVVAVAGTDLPTLTTAAPNPTAGPLDVTATGITQATVLNALGSTVLVQQLAAPAERISLNLSSLPAGIYLVRLTTVNGPQVVRVTRN